MKTRTSLELENIKTSWYITEDGIVCWNRNAKKGICAGDQVGLSKMKSGHLSCCLTTNKKANCYSIGQVAWFLHNNEWPSNEIDHIDNNPTNNTKANLRLANRAEQCTNRIAGVLGRKNKGIYKRKTKNGYTWRCQLQVNGKQTCLGTFDAKEDAIEFIELAVQMLHKDFANIKSYERLV
jgi:hypothetical protein